MSYVYRSQECIRIETECNEGRDPYLVFHRITLQALTQITLFTSLMRRPNRGGDFPERTRQSPLPNLLPSFTPNQQYHTNSPTQQQFPFDTYPY